MISTFNLMSFESFLVKHASTIQHFRIKQPITKIPESFINLKRLELDDNFS